MDPQRTLLTAPAFVLTNFRQAMQATANDSQPRSRLSSTASNSTFSDQTGQQSDFKREHSNSPSSSNQTSVHNQVIPELSEIDEPECSDEDGDPDLQPLLLPLPPRQRSHEDKIDNLVLLT